VATAAYERWRADGSPWSVARPIKAIGNRLRAAGYTVYYLGNDEHLWSSMPEDHCPFSFTGWPVPNPYPFVDACDVMPPKRAGLPSLAALGVQLRRDKIAGHPGATWLKYMNWEPDGPGGPCYHDSWQPEYRRQASGDRGHMHLSGRSDFVRYTGADSYDLVARVRGKDDQMSPEQMKELKAHIDGQMLRGLSWLAAGRTNSLLNPDLQPWITDATTLPELAELVKGEPLVALTPADRAAIVEELVVQLRPHLGKALADVLEGTRLDAPPFSGG
jgi:hypothetical protein